MVEIKLKLRILKSWKLQSPDTDYVRGWEQIRKKIISIDREYRQPGEHKELEFKCPLGHELLK